MQIRAHCIFLVQIWVLHWKIIIRLLFVLFRMCVCVRSLNFWTYPIFSYFVESFFECVVVIAHSSTK